MARIRTVKPEFWSSPSNEGMSPWARLLFVAMWNWADDTGRGACTIGELAGFAFPYDEFSAADIRRMLGEIRRGFGVFFYKAAGRPYYYIPSWEQHQKIDKRSTGRWPHPSEGYEWDPEADTVSDQRDHIFSADSAEFPPEGRRDSGAGTGEQGNIGTEQTSASDDAAVLPDMPKKPKDDRSDFEAEFALFWKTYPLKKGKQAAYGAFVKARKSGINLDRMCEAASKYRNEMRGVPPGKIKWAQGWINDARWMDYEEQDAEPSTREDALAWLKREWEAGRVKQIEEQTGLTYRMPDTPDECETRDQVVAFHAQARKDWIVANRDEIVRRLTVKAVA